MSNKITRMAGNLWIFLALCCGECQLGSRLNPNVVVQPCPLGALMVHVDPGWFEAAGTDAMAAKIGVDMLLHKKAQSAAPTAPAASIPAYGITGAEFLLGMVILALALLGAAAIAHHGLTA